MQHLAVADSSLKELCYPRGLLQRCQNDLWEMGTGGHAALPGAQPRPIGLQVLVDHFPTLDPFDFEERARGQVLGLSALVWARLETMAGQMPFSLLAAVDPRLSAEAQEAVVQGFLSLPECELDEGFSLPLQQACKTKSAKDFLAVYGGMLRVVGQTGHATNVGRENQLVQMASAAVSTRRTPTGEKVCYAGALSWLMSRHLAAGGRGARAMLREDLVKQGVPIAASRQRGRGTTRHHIAYGNLRFAEWAKGNPFAFPGRGARSQGFLCSCMGKPL